MKFKTGDRVKHKNGSTGEVKHTYGGSLVSVLWDEPVEAHYEGEKESSMEKQCYAREQDLSFEMKSDPDWSDTWDKNSI